MSIDAGAATKPDEAIAWHEAGHAVLVWLLHLDIRRVRFSPGSEKSTAEVRSGLPHDTDHEGQFRYACVCLAAKPAERYYADLLRQSDPNADISWTYVGWTNDEGQAFTALDRILGPDASLTLMDSIFDRARKIAKDLVERHVAQVHLVATALLAKHDRDLGAEELRSLLGPAPESYLMLPSREQLEADIRERAEMRERMERFNVESRRAEVE